MGRPVRVARPTPDGSGVKVRIEGTSTQFEYRGQKTNLRQPRQAWNAQGCRPPTDWLNSGQVSPPPRRLGAWPGSSAGRTGAGDADPQESAAVLLATQALQTRRCCRPPTRTSSIVSCMPSSANVYSFNVVNDSSEICHRTIRVNWLPEGAGHDPGVRNSAGALAAVRYSSCAAGCRVLHALCYPRPETPILHHRQA